jgi:hypothetical protein
VAALFKAWQALLGTDDDDDGSSPVSAQRRIGNGIIALGARIATSAEPAKSP